MNLTVPSCKKQIVGKNGEEKAFEYFKSLGYNIIARNWRVRTGEIDLIVEKDNVIVFVEVKTLPAGNGEFLAHVLNKKKQRIIIKTAKYFLATNRKYNNCFIRFDVVVIDMPGLDPVYHIKNAFSEFI